MIVQKCVPLHQFLSPYQALLHSTPQANILLHIYLGFMFLLLESKAWEVSPVYHSRAVPDM